MWNPELDSIVVGLSIRTLGSAATAGTDDVAPMFQVPDVDASDPCCDFYVGGSGGGVVSRGPSWHCSLALLFTICFLGCSGVGVGGKLLEEGVRRTDSFQESSPSYVCVAVRGNHYVRVAVSSFPDDSYCRVPFPRDVMLHPHLFFPSEFCVVAGVFVSCTFRISRCFVSASCRAGLGLCLLSCEGQQLSLSSAVEQLTWGDAVGPGHVSPCCYGQLDILPLLVASSYDGFDVFHSCLCQAVGFGVVRGGKLVLYAVFVAELGELASKLRAAVCSYCCWPAEFNEPIGQLTDICCCVCAS